MVCEPHRKATETEKVLELLDRVIWSVESKNRTLGLTICGVV